MKTKLGRKIFEKWSQNNQNALDEQINQNESEQEKMSEIIVDEGKDVDKLVMRKKILKKMSQNLEAFDRTMQDEAFFDNFYDPLDYDM